MIFDLETAYIGSANLTGAGMGMKGEHTRNFEALFKRILLIHLFVNQRKEAYFYNLVAIKIQ
jgi:hypothetical protein